MNAADYVGPVLQNCSVSQSIIAAIKKMNPLTQVIERGSYFRILVPGQCIVSRKEIELHLGSAFRLPKDLEAVMSSFKGIFTVSEEEACWKFEAKSGDSHHV